jgi:hypothetical protein
MSKRISLSLVAAVAVALSSATFLAACQLADRTATLQSGPYLMTSTFVEVVGGTPNPARPVAVNLTNNNGEVTIIVLSQRKYPIVGTLIAGEFRGHMGDPGGTVELTGRLTSNNRIEGEVVRTSDQGARTVSGHFALAPAMEAGVVK